MEKEGYAGGSPEKYSNETPPYEDPARITEEKSVRIREPVDLYGNLATAEDYGYVTRGYGRELQLVSGVRMQD